MACGRYAAVVERGVLEGAEAGWVLDLLNGHFGVFVHKPTDDDEEIDSETLCLFADTPGQYVDLSVAEVGVPQRLRRPRWCLLGGS